MQEYWENWKEKTAWNIQYLQLSGKAALSPIFLRRQVRPPLPSPDGIACFVLSCWIRSIDGVWYVNTLMHLTKEGIILAGPQMKSYTKCRHTILFHLWLDELVSRGQMNAVVSGSLIGYSVWLETFQREMWMIGRDKLQNMSWFLEAVKSGRLPGKERGEGHMTGFRDNYEILYCRVYS